MRIVFDVRFPLKLTAEQRDAVRAALQGAQYNLTRQPPGAAPRTF